MANPIPPLVCSTPPPIDDFEEISQIDDNADIDFGEYETNTDIEFGSFEGPSLPNTPRHINIINNNISEDVNTDSIPNSCDSNNLEKCETSQIKEVEKVEFVPIITSDEKITVNIENNSSEETINMEPNDDSISIEVHRIDEVKIEECDAKQSNNSENRFEKFESPPSLELTLQVVSDEYDSFEKLSNGSKESDKEFYDNSLESNSGSIAAKADVEPDIPNATEQIVGFQFDDFLKDHATEKTEIIPNVENEEICSSPIAGALRETLLVENSEYEHTLRKIYEDNYILVEENLKPNSSTGCEIESNELIEKSFVSGENLNFEADFSQFENSLPAGISLEIKNIDFPCKDEINKENITTSNEEFDSFQDFEQENENILSRTKQKNLKDNITDSVFLNSSNSNDIPQTKNYSKSKNHENYEDFDDDEFGEFGDFKEAPFTAIANITNDRAKNLEVEKAHNDCPNINDKFLSILDSMFPLLESCDITTDGKITKSIGEFTQDHSIMANLNHIDSANALDYQWSSSNTRHALIKSLGIDSRNILYGEKWNCSMPRFASNLGFTPLEPLKPVKIDNKTQQPTNSSVSNNSNGTNGSTINKNNSVPDVEFDWNSSGLINPLDASHAHTLLLDYDLDQLVVVANLDNIKLDSYSSYLYTSSSSASTSTSTSTLLSTTSYCTANSITTTTTGSTTTAPSSLKYFEHRWVNINHDNNVTPGTTLGNGTMHNFSTNSTYLNSHTINNNKKYISMEFGSNHHHYADIVNHTNPNIFKNINASMNATNATINKTNDIMFDYSLSSRDKKQLQEEQNIKIHSATNESSEVDSSIESSKIKNESIETNLPTKYEIRTETISNDIEFAGSVSSSFNENNSTEFTASKTKSEFTNDDDDDPTKSKVASIDVELSSEPKTTATPGTEKLPIVDISLGITSMPINSKSILSSATNITDQLSINENTNNKISDSYLKQHNNYSNDYMNIVPLPTTYVVPLKETHIFTPTKSENPISQSTGGDFISNCNPNSTISSLGGSIETDIAESIDFDYEIAAAGTVINEKVIKKEYHDVEYDPSKFGLTTLDFNSAENDEINSVHNKNNDLKCTDASCLDTIDINMKTSQNSMSNWTFHLNNLDDGTVNPQQLDTEILNTSNRLDPVPFIFGSNQSIENPTTNASATTLSNDLSNDLKQNFEDDFNNSRKFDTLSNLEPTKTFNNTKFMENSTFNNISKNSCDSFDDEFTDFQSVLPIQEYKNNIKNPVQSPSNFVITHQDKFLESDTVLVNKSLKDNSSRNNTPTLPSDDRMILSPAILLPQAVSVNQSTNQTPKIDWPEPGISSDELARLENIFPQAKSSAVKNLINSEQKDNLNSLNNEDDWSDFMSVPPLPQNNLPYQPSPKSVNHGSNLNIIYNPQSPTKVSSKRSTTHSNKSNDEDEWSDFVSSAPIPSNLTNSSSNFAQSSNHHFNSTVMNTHQLNYPHKHVNSQFLPSDQQYFNHNNTIVPSQQQQQHGFLNNNKISQYLLSNTSSGHTDSHVNNGSNNMQLNSLKPTDFIPHHHTQHQLLQKQKRILIQSTNNGGGNIGNNISFIPDLGFSSPQNQFINMTKRNYQRK